MKVGGATYCKKSLRSELERLKDTGYDFAELNLGSPIQPSEEFRAKLNKVKNILPTLVAHLPEIDFKNEEIKKHKKFMEILSKENVKLFVIHLFSRNLPTKGNLALKIKGLKELASFAKKNNCSLALENTEEDARILKKVFNAIPGLFFCLDIGHANLFAKENRSVDLIKNFGSILKHVHAHDNLGGDAEKYDSHLPIGKGKINFAPIFNKLKEIKYSGNVTLEIYNPNKKYRQVSLVRVRSFS